MSDKDESEALQKEAELAFNCAERDKEMKLDRLITLKDAKTNRNLRHVWGGGGEITIGFGKRAGADSESGDSSLGPAPLESWSGNDDGKNKSGF